MRKFFTNLFFRTSLLILFIVTGWGSTAFAQQKPEFTSVTGNLIRVTPKLTDIDVNSMYGKPFVITRDMNGLIGRSDEGEEEVEEAIRKSSREGASLAMQDPNTVYPNSLVPSLGVHFDGQNWVGIDPSDNNMAAGPNHVIQMINATSSSYFKIWDKAGNVVQNASLLSALTGITGGGDPVVIYDQLADRWILTEFGPGGTTQNYLVMAVSTTPNPLGTWNIYQFTDNTFFPDYPKFSVWHNAYYATTNDFSVGAGTYQGSSIWAFDRTAMLAGAPTATMIRSRRTSASNVYYNMGTVCLEGTATASQNGLFVYPDGSSNLGIFEFTPNFASPGSSVIGATSFLPIAAYSQPPTAVAQQGTASTIQTLGSRMMFRLNYKNRGGIETIVCTHTVRGSSASQAAVRWYELRRVAANWTVYQQGTLANADGNNRWMGGISMDDNGSIALVYDVSGSTAYPSIRYTGRDLGDPLGTMTLTEQTIVNGTGAHTATARWGDYNTLVSDPSTVGSFWGTSEYSTHSTHVFNFSFAAPPVCSGTPNPGNTVLVSATMPVCSGGGFTLGLQNTTGTGATYQWQSSTDAAFTSPVDLGTTNAQATSATGDLYYRCVVTCSGNTGISNPLLVTVFTAPVAPDVARCGTGTVTLSASSGGSNYYWYSSGTTPPADGSYVGTGTTFTTPVLSATTNYYVQTINGYGTTPVNLATGFSTNLSCGAAAGGYADMFNLKALTQPLSITSLPLTAYSTNTRTVRMYYRTGTYAGHETSSTGWVLAASGSIALTGGNVYSINITPFVIPAGQTYGIYVWVSGDRGYSLSGANNYSDADLSIICGSRQCGSGSVFTGTLTSGTSILGSVNYLLPGCTTGFTTSKAVIDAGYTWYGGSDAVWANSGNWSSCGVFPGSGQNLTIATTGSNPTLPGNVTIGDLVLNSGTKLSIGSNTLTVNGAVTGTGTITGSSASNLVLAGAAGTLNFTTGTSNAADHSLNNLTLNTGASAVLNDSLSIYGTVSLTSAILNLNAKNLTLKSNTTGTGRIANLTGNTLSNATNVTVERWIPLRGGVPATGGRAYRLLAPTVLTTTPVSTSIKDNWMEGGQVTTVGGTSNPVLNYGTHITGGIVANGFDRTQTNQASLFLTTNAITPTYTAIGDVNGDLNPYTGYFLFIRGDRAQSLSANNTNVPPTPVPLPTSSTTLRATGTLQQGTKTTFTNAIVPVANTMNLITNPYPSALDWNLVYTASTNLKNAYTLWDPNIGYRGGWVTVTNAGVVSGGGLATRFIQPGQAFFVETNATAATTVSVQESHKAVGNNNAVFFVDPLTVQTFTAALYYYEGTGNRRHADGVTAIYDNSFSASVDGEDASEINNWDENIAIDRENKHLAIEARPLIVNKDTLPLFMNNMKLMNYELEFKGSNFSNPAITATLIDNFTGARTLLSVSGTIVVPITVSSNPASSASNRFMVVFGSSGPLPIDLSSVKAYEKNAGIQVDWVMNTEQDMDKYEVEKSADGRNFVKATTVLSRGNSSVQVNYGWFDANPVFGDNFYRIKSIDKGGQYKHSNIVRVNLGKGAGTGISMYPNPFEGSGLNLQMVKLAAGKYTLIIYNNLGQQVYSGNVTHSGGSATQFIDTGKSLSAGNYTVRLNGNGLKLSCSITKK